MRVCSRPVVSAPHHPSGTFLSFPKTASELVFMISPSYQTTSFTDDSTPFARRAGEASTKVKPAGHVTKSQVRAATIANSNPPKQPAVHLSSKGGRSVRAAPTPIAGSTRKSPQINPPTRAATATGRLVSTTHIGPVSTSCIHARPAASASLRPPTAVTRTVRLSTKLQNGHNATGCGSRYCSRMQPMKSKRSAWKKNSNTRVARPRSLRSRYKN